MCFSLRSVHSKLHFTLVSSYLVRLSLSLAVQGVEHLASKWCRNVWTRFAGRRVTVQRDGGAGDVRFLEPESSIPFEEGMQLFVFLLRCGQYISSYRRGDGLYMKKGVSDDVVLAGYMSYVRGALRNVVQVVELSRLTLFPLLVECVYEGFVVREDYEVPSFQQVAKVFHGLVDRQQLPVVGAILLLRRT